MLYVYTDRYRNNQVISKKIGQTDKKSKFSLHINTNLYNLACLWLLLILHMFKRVIRCLREGGMGGDVKSNVH